MQTTQLVRCTRNAVVHLELGSKADGTIKIAIFGNETKNERDRVRYSGKLTRSYKDASGDWHDTEYLSGTEFLRAARLMERAYDQELTLRADSSAQNTPEPNG